MGARVHHVKAGKDYPDQGIKKGEMHYTWALFRQRARRSKVKPTRSQLESSEFKSAYYALVDSNLPAATCDGDLETLAGEVRSLADEERSKVENLPENFQQGEQGERLNNRADELETWADEIESAAAELGSEEDWSPEEDGDDEAQTYADALRAKIEDLEQSAPDPE